MAAAATIATSEATHRLAPVIQVTHAMSDVDAVALAREGDHQAFKLLVDRHQDRVYGLSLRILRDPEEARDACQEAFLKAYRSLRKFEGRSAFGTWMYRLTFNHCLDMKRRHKGARHVEFEEERLDAEPGMGVDPSTSVHRAASPGVALERAELRGQIAEAIEQLPEDARQTLLLREVEGLAYSEIAEMMGIPKGTVMSRLHHARKRVRALLEDMGISPATSSTPVAEEAEKSERGRS